MIDKDDISKVLDETRSELDALSPEEREQVTSDAMFIGMERAFHAGVKWGRDFSPSGDLDEDRVAFGVFMMAEAVFAMKSRGLDVSDLDDAIPGE